jgi:hypothetical protein
MQPHPEIRRMLANQRANELRGAAAQPFPWPRLRLGARSSAGASRVAAELAGLRGRRREAGAREALEV